MEQNHLKSLSFREKRKRSWKKLDFLLNRVEREGIKSLSPDEITEMAQLYRTACSSLQVARTVSLDRNLHQYLENLVTQGYLIIYCTRPVIEQPIGNFFLRQFPQTVRKYFFFHLAAFLIVLSGFVVSYVATVSDASYYFAFVSREMAQDRTPHSSKGSLASSLEGGRDSTNSELTYFSSMLFTHNTKVGFLAFSLGILLAFPTVFLMFYNGCTLGAMSYLFHSHGLGVDWWAWILAHGVTEVLAIVLCGGAGIMIGMALVQPGPYGRLEKLKTVGRDAGIIVMGTVLLFFIAGLIEGFFRQSNLSNLPRYVLAVASLAFWVFYFGFVGREKGDGKFQTRGN